ncbi:MAG: MFS transporter [Candidatus Beckwithbacteria bacterium]|nr:MFS transporter [Patescibacteria group bacterium]
MKLKFNNVYKVALIQFFSSLYFYLPVLTIYYQRRGLNFVQINSLWGIITASIFLAEIPTGIIADKIGRKKSVIIALLLQLIGEISFIFAQNYSQFILISIIAGIGFAFQSGCIQALVYDSLKENNKEDEMKKATGITGAFMQSGLILGALFSSLLIANLIPTKITLAIILTAISVFVAFLISFSIKEPVIKYIHQEESPIKILTESVRLIKNNKSLRRIVWLGVFTTPFAGYLRNFHPPYFELAGIPSVWLGLSLGLGGIIAVIASKYAYKIEEIFGVKIGMLVATLLPGFIYLWMTYVFSPVLATLLFILNYGSMSLQSPLFADYYNRHIRSEIRATALSTINMISSIYITLIGLLIGWLADIKLSWAFLLMGGIIILGSVIFRIDKKHLVKVEEK